MTILSTNKINFINNYVNKDDDPDKKVKDEIQKIWNKYFSKEANSDLILVLEQLLTMLAQLKTIPNIDFSKLTFKVENGKVIISYKNQEIFSAEKNSKIEEILSNYLIKQENNNYIFDEYKIHSTIQEIKIRNYLGESYVSEEMFNQGYFLTLSILNSVLNSIDRKSTNRLLKNANSIKININNYDLKNEYKILNNFADSLNQKISTGESVNKVFKNFNNFLETHFNSLINIINEPTLITDDQSNKELAVNLKKHKYIRTLFKSLIYVLQVMEKNQYTHQTNLYERLLKNNTLIGNIKEYITNNKAVHNTSLDFFNKELTIFKRNLEEFYERYSNSKLENNKDSDLIKKLTEVKKLLNNIQIQGR